MNTRRLFSFLLSFLLIAGCFVLPAGAVEVFDEETQLVITRATGRFEKTIPANSIYPVCDSFILDRGDVVSYDCTYNPKSANIKFGYIAPDGYFYGVEGSSGSFKQSIRVGQHGTYTLAIWNKSDEAVTVEGTVNY